MQQQEILLVEDTLTQAMGITHILSTKYQVKLARSGREALELLGTYRPALILSDINMPEMDGYQLCARIKETPEYATIPFVLMIFPLDNQDTINIINSGADDLVGKIFESEYLLGRLSDILDNGSDQINQTDQASHTEQISQTNQTSQTSETGTNGQSVGKPGRDDLDAEVLRLRHLLVSAIELVAHHNRAND